MNVSHFVFVLFNYFESEFYLHFMVNIGYYRNLQLKWLSARSENESESNSLHRRQTDIKNGVIISPEKIALKEKISQSFEFFEKIRLNFQW